MGGGGVGHWVADPRASIRAGGHCLSRALYFERLLNPTTAIMYLLH